MNLRPIIQTTILLAILVAILSVCGAIALSANPYLEAAQRLAVHEASERTGLPYDGQPLPTVKRLSQQEMWETFYSALPYDPEAAVKPQALFDHEHNTIYLTLGMAPTNVVDYSILLHEHVHYLQFINGLYDKVRCMAELEKLAYKTQIDYLRDRGIEDPFKALGINGLTLLLITTCPEDFS